MVATDVGTNGAQANRRRSRLAGRGTAGRPSVPAPPGRRVRVPELAVGVVVMAVFAVGVVVWHLGSVERVPALALANPVARGEVLDVDDLRIVNVSADRGVARLAPEAIEAVVGRVALADLPAGALVTEGMVADGSAVAADQGIVGLSLEPGQYPTADVATGDRVDVVLGRAASASSASGGEGASASPVLAESAEVVAVQDLSAERKLVSLRATDAEARSVAAADGATVRLVLVAS